MFVKTYLYVYAHGPVGLMLIKIILLSYYNQAGTITCEKRQCNRVRCTNPTFDECDCPVCGQQCLYEGRTYSNREGFRNPADPCEECQCRVSRYSLFDE